MELFEAIKSRRSIRKYKKGAVIPREDILKMTGAGACAPSARAVNPWKFVAITERKKLDELQAIVGNNGRFLLDASAAILVICEDTKYYIEDGCAATENILLAAHGLGYGACWIAGDKKDYCEAVLSFIKAPQNSRLICMISLGLPGETPVKEKPGAEEVTLFESF